MSTALEEAERQLAEGNDKWAFKALWTVEAEEFGDRDRLERARRVADALAARSEGRRQKDARILRDVFAGRVTALIDPSPISPRVPASELSAGNVRAIRYISAALFVAAALTVFLPYFAVEREADIFTGATAHTYHYSGVRLMSGSYKNSNANAATFAEDGSFLPFLVLIWAFIGLATVRSRHHAQVAGVLLALSIVLLIGGCGATWELHLFGSAWNKHLEVGFILAAFCLIAATILRFVVWRMTKENGAGSPGPNGKS
jgi:hypothetical protein